MESVAKAFSYNVNIKFDCCIFVFLQISNYGKKKKKKRKKFCAITDKFATHKIFF